MIILTAWNYRFYSNRLLSIIIIIITTIIAVKITFNSYIISYTEQN